MDGLVNTASSFLERPFLYHLPAVCLQHLSTTPFLNVYMKYNWLAFLSRLAFICNLCFLVMFIIHFTHNFLASFGNIIGTIVILGFVSLIINLVLQAILTVRRIQKKNIPIRAWIRIFNLAVFVLQVWYYFSLPGA